MHPEKSDRLTLILAVIIYSTSILGFRRKTDGLRFINNVTAAFGAAHVAIKRATAEERKISKGEMRVSDM